jgi:DNA-binding CsgD family transcriptional regulator
VRTAQGDHEAVVAELLPFLGPQIIHRNGIDEAGIISWRPLLIESLVRIGRMDEAEEVLAAYENRAAARLRWLDQAAAARCRGTLEGARGRTDAAERAFKTALGYCERGEPCFEQALLHLAYGAFLRRLGKRGGAGAELQAAWEIFHRLQATPYLERCRTELAACGRTDVRAAGAGHPELTPQELTVAGLATQGMTNRQIAQELVLSVKTVEFHLGNVYTKFGVRTRAGLISRFATGA